MEMNQIEGYEGPEEDNKLIWKGVEYDNLDDYRKAIDDSGASGKAGESLMGETATLAGSAATVLAPGLVSKAAKTWGVGKVLDVGMQAIGLDQEDTLLEQYAELLPKHGSKLKTGIKASRLLANKLDSWLDPKKWKNVGNAVKSGFEEVIETPGRIKNTVEEAFTGLDAGTGGARAMSGGAEEGSRQWGLFNRGGIRDSTYDHWKYKDEGWMSSNEARKTLEAYQTGSRQYVPGFFEAESRRLRPGYIEEYGDYMVKNGLATAEDVARGKVGHNLELHHMTPLKASAPLYHNTNHGDEAWTVITDVFNKHGLFPGQGLPSPIESVSKSNYFMALKEPHNILHNNFLMDLLGRDGSTFFTPARMELIESGLEGRKLVAEEYALHIKQGQAILEDGMKQMEALFSKSGVPPEELADLLSRASNAGELKILDTDLMVRSVNDQLRNIAEEASWEDYGTALGDEVPEVLQRHLDKAVQSWYNRVMKQYGLSGKGGLGRPPIQL